MASNIRVVLEVDNKKYIAEVKRAQDATNSFAQTAQKGVGSLSPAIVGLTTAFSGLAATVASLGFGAAIAKSIAFADSVKDINNATDIAVENILGFSDAVAANGGSAEGARTAILRLVGTIEEAAGGSKELQNTFASVGVSLKDLASLSEQDILAKTIQGLSKMQNSSERVAAAQKLLGKEFRQVDFRGVAGDYSAATQQATAYRASIESLAAMQDKLDRAFLAVQKTLLKLVEPLADFINGLSQEQIDQFVTGLVKLAGAIAAIAAAIPAISAIGTIITSVAASIGLAKVGAVSMAAAFGIAGTAAGSLGTTLGKSAESLSQWWRQTPRFSELGGKVGSLGKLFGELGQRGAYATGALATIGTALKGLFSGFLRFIPVIGQLVAGFFILDSAVELITGKDIGAWFNQGLEAMSNFARKIPGVASLLDGLRKMFGMPSLADEKENTGELQRLKNRANAAKEAADRVAESNKQEADSRRQVKTELDKFTQGQREQLISYEQAAAAAKRQLNLEQSLVGASDQQQQQERARFSVIEDRIKAVEQLEAQIRSLKVEEADDKTGVTSAKIKVLQKSIQDITAASSQYVAQQVAGVQAIQAVEAAERMKIARLVQINDLENIRAQLLGYTLSETDKLNQAERAGDFRSKTQDEIKLLKEQALARDALTAQLTTDNVTRSTSIKLLELETSIMGMQLTEMQKLEMARASNPEAFERKTEAETNALKAQAQALDDAATKFRALAFARDLQRQGEDFSAGVREQLNLDRAIGESARRRINIEIEGRNQLQSKLREIADRYGDEKNLSEELRATRQKEIDDATAGINKLISLKRQSVEEDQAIRDSFQFGWETAFGKYAEDALNAANQSKTYFETFTKGFEDAFVKFVQTGKISFKDLANSIIADFARIQAKKLLTGAFGGGGGGGGFFGNILGSIGSIFGFASGGNPAIGKPMIVGERGPELMIPRNASTIIPNEALGGSNQTTVNYNIQAVDAASFQQLVARDPKFLHAVVEKGRRSLPQGARR